MGPVRGRKRIGHYDPELIENWTLVSLKEELNKKGVRFPKNARRMALVRLLQLNTGENAVATQRNNNSSTRGDHMDIYSGARSHDSTQNARGDVSICMFGSAVSQDASLINNGDTDNNRVLIGLVSKLSTTVQTLQQNVSSLTIKVNALITERPEIPGQARMVEPVVNRTTTTNLDLNSTAGSTQFNLETAYNALRRPVPSAAAGSEEQLGNVSSSGRTARGFAVESLPFVETISPQLKRNIITGMDINLASLLIPYYSGSGVMEADYLGVDKSQSTKHDPRTNRALTLGEFIQAFGTYKNIMCSAFPNRRSELDLYERDLVDMATRYPGKGFYEYHKRFSADAGAHLRYNNIPVDWSIRNNTLFCNIFANTKPNTCNTCGSTFHTTGFCNQSSINVRNQFGLSRSPDQDTYGRERVYYLGREICNNFNGPKGCSNLRCRNSHVCIVCKADHPKLVCSQAKNDGQGPQKIGANIQRRM